jgi:predicted transcriptional regulator
MTKVTKKDNFNAIVEVLEKAGKPELVTVMKHEIELLEKKNSYKSSKPTKAQTENEGIKSQIMEVLSAEPNRLFTATEVVKAVNPELSNQRVSALLRQLVEAGSVAKTIDKRKSYFQAC